MNEVVGVEVTARVGDATAEAITEIEEGLAGLSGEGYNI